MLTLPVVSSALLSLTPVAHGAPQVGAILRTETVGDVAVERRALNGVDPAEDVLTQHTWARMFASDETERGDRWFLEGRFQHHVLVGDDVEAWYELGLGESGWDGRLGGPESPARLRAGVLRERWGKTDLLPVLDVLNPTDARIGPLTDPAHRRLPVPMATLQLGTGRFRSETTVIPFAGADRLWLRETDWSLIRQDMVEDFIQNDLGRDPLVDGWFDELPLADQDVLRPTIDAALENVQNLDPSLRRGQDYTTNTDGLPQAFVGNGELAQRLEWRGNNVDVALVGGLLRSTFPQAVLDAEFRNVLEQEALPQGTDEQSALQQAALVGTPLEVTWPRTAMAGIEGSGLVGPLQVRAEAGYWTDRVVRRHFGNSQTVPQAAAAVGIDYVRGTTFLATLEARWQHLFDAPGDLVFSKPDQVQIALGVQASFLAERLKLTVGGAYDASFQELMLRPTLAWRVSDRVQLEAGGLVLEGFETDAPAGLLEALTYEGGPASFWSQNDSVTVALSLFL